MWQFVVGLVVGGVMGFFICAVLSVNHSGNGETPAVPTGEERDDQNA